MMVYRILQCDNALDLFLMYIFRHGLVGRLPHRWSRRTRVQQILRAAPLRRPRYRKVWYPDLLDR